MGTSDYEFQFAAIEQILLTSLKIDARTGRRKLIGFCCTNQLNASHVRFLKTEIDITSKKQRQLVF